METPVPVSPLRMAHWMGAAPRVPGQQGGVDVDAAQWRQLQHRPGENLAVGRHHDDLRAQGAQRGREGGVTRALRLQEGVAGLFRYSFDNWRLRPQFPPLGPVRPRHHRHDRELLRGQERVQTGAGQVRRSHEDNP